MLTLEPVQSRHEENFLAAARRSTDLHQPWISPPLTHEGFQAYLARYAHDNQVSLLARDGAGNLVGCVHFNEIVRGALQSAYLAYWVFVPFQQRGLMKQTLSLAVSHAFNVLDLHRVEANIQPANAASKALVLSLGFRLEGFAPRYLQIDGEWRDHERYALTAEEWKDTRHP